MTQPKHSIMELLLKEFILFIIGGILYVGIEILFRGYSYISMFILGGLCFLLIGCVNEKYPWEMPLISQMFISMCIVTALEFIFGVVLNLWLKLGIWNYSSLPYNLCGQICLLFSVGWFFLSIPAILIDDALRWVLFGEEKPHYSIFCAKIPSE